MRVFLCWVLNEHMAFRMCAQPSSRPQQVMSHLDTNRMIQRIDALTSTMTWLASWLSECVLAASTEADVVV